MPGGCILGGPSKMALHGLHSGERQGSSRLPGVLCEAPVVQHSLRQDHAAKDMLAEFEKRGIRLIFWPPFLPDLNPIKTVWNLMKDWIQEHYSGDKLDYRVLKEAVQQAREAIEWQQLEDLLVTMPRRCEAVIAANGMYTKF